MYTEERRLLTDFLDQLKRAVVSARDSEAEALINQAVAQQPDAAYLLVQKALLQEQALNAAKTQIVQLQDQIDRLRIRNSQSGGFLGADPWDASTGHPASAAGAFLFRGIESLLHRDSGGGFLDLASTSPENVENIAVNDYDNADEPALDLGPEQADFVDDGIDEFDGYNDDESPEL